MVLLGPVCAAAQEASPEDALSEIREMALYARYREARDAVQTYLAREDLSAAQRNVGLEVLATVHIAMRDERAATEALQRLYARDPGYRLSDPDASPPVLSAFGRARSNPPAPIEVQLVHDPITLEHRGPARIRVGLGAGADAVNELRLRYRQGEDTRFTTVVMSLDPDGTATARLPVLDQPEAYDIVYVIEALAPSDTVLARLGTESEPLRFTMPEASAVASGGGAGGTGPAGEAAGGDDFTWLAIVIAVVVVAGGVTAGILIADQLSGPQDGSLGNIQLPLVRF